ncbi:hypothetical protein [Vitiosangium sp. GDMCC 1.1324]|uniref:hypothetical protein n=1 Tax=Vitiosangium sp. (strain GDMCC 1.1324) TaxID=2138576 RepID=UPI000D38C46F|nr:hypothetical protein [Vitiosangium sp. GDMCC 1.1324]PTL84876.1 hypothetical protein DAT35_07425 [Vitiosangium sp. GDMCC 1.1324]
MGTRSLPQFPALSSPPPAEPSTDTALVARVEPAPSGSPLLFSGLASVVLGVMRSLGMAVRCLAFGIGGLLVGRFARGSNHLRRAVMTLVRLPLDVMLSLGGRLLSGAQTLLGVEPVGCRLAAKQLTELRKVFGDGLDYERVRLKVGRLGLLALAGRPFALGNTLYVPRDLPRKESGAGQLPMHLLMRGMGHIWQYQTGGTDHVCETLWARGFGDGADWRTALDEDRSWRELDPEQQARFLQVAYARSGYFLAPGQRFVDEDTGVDYTRQLEAALEQVRTRRGAP